MFTTFARQRSCRLAASPYIDQSVSGPPLAAVSQDCIGKPLPRAEHRHTENTLGLIITPQGALAARAATKRCAIYTRKCSEERLEQDFTLDLCRSDGLLRLSIGLENVADILEDIKQALDAREGHR